ncbi:MAG: hypothetical protein GXZ07_04275 [Firmicutes bacterium]|nr:hypothetical protein [Bacillota bacterium]
MDIPYYNSPAVPRIVIFNALIIHPVSSSIFLHRFWIVPKLLKDGEKADVAVVGPPHNGCDAALLNTLAKMQPQRIVYVSCNPATLAWDLKILHQKGYTPLEAQRVDMFPHTGHIECTYEVPGVKRLTE